MLFDPASAFIATVGEDHTLVLPDSVPSGSRVAVVIIEPVSVTTPVAEPTQETVNETQADAWDLLFDLVRSAPSGQLMDASENHDHYLYGDRL